MRGRFVDRLQWSAIVIVLLTQEVLVGLIGHSLRQGLRLVKDKAARVWRRR